MAESGAGDSMIGRKILVVVDDDFIAGALQEIFGKHGAAVFRTNDGPEALRAIYAVQPALIILDTVLPTVDGFETLENIRRVSKVPAVMLTSAGVAEADFKNGRWCPVYFVQKPFTPNNLLRPVRSALHLAPDDGVDGLGSLSFNDDYLVINGSGQVVEVAGRSVSLTRTELDILLYLLRRNGCSVTARELLREIWGLQYENSTDYVHVYIARLRKKLEPDPRNPRYLITEHGVGYRFQTI